MSLSLADFSQSDKYRLTGPTIVLTMSDMHERFPEKASFRYAREAKEHVNRIAAADKQSFGAVLRRLVAKALRTEKVR